MSESFFKWDQQKLTTHVDTMDNEHKKIHADLIERLKQHGSEFDKSGVLTPAFFQFLKTWLTAHIMGIDTKYGLVASQQAS